MPSRCYSLLSSENNYVSKIGVQTGLNFLFHLHSFSFVTKLHNAPEVTLLPFIISQIKVTADENAH